ncbi:MAG: GNAT family N-acetyltransferase [candidate division Zixibacteria bacterium]|nr:GNAT family N-acetyltransferase [candidate division Zixibacteria bacterium]
MDAIDVHDMRPEEEPFVGTCSHVNESEEIDRSAKIRMAWLTDMIEKGLRIKVATIADEIVGKAYVMPIEIYTWGLSGRDIMAMPCLWVPPEHQKKGVGRALIAEAVAETNWQGKGALAVVGFDWDIFFMPASFFRKQGLAEVTRRGNEVLLWWPLSFDVEPPEFMESQYVFNPIPGKVAVDLFWNSFCLTSVNEAGRVRDVVGEFADKVVLREYVADDRMVLMQYRIPRGIMINGKEVGWGYAAPRDKLREEIQKALGE